MNKEIERKYEMKCMPENIEIEKIEDIEQAYIYHDKYTTIRLRKNKITEKDGKQEINYIYTVKTKGDIQYKDTEMAEVYEIESNITKEDYENILEKQIGNTIRKTRIVVPIENNLKVEIDIYYDYLQDFLTAEIEFANIEEANKFNKPDWLGEEIGHKEFSNRRLSRMNQKEFRDKVSTETLDNNKIIIEKLKKLIK